MKENFVLPRQLLLALTLVVVFILSTTQCQSESVIVAPEPIDGSVMVASSAIGDDDSADGADPVRYENLTYVLDWREEGETLQSELGYEISLDTAYIVNGSVELIPCEDETSFFAPFLAQTAYAGHGITDAGESRLAMGYVESLADIQAVEVGKATSAQGVYCQAHYLLGPAFDSAENIPSGINLLGKTIYFSGSYMQDGATERVPFVIESELAWGGFLTLSEPLDSGNASVTVTLERNLSLLLTDVDFATMDDAERAKAILRSVVKHADVSVQFSN